MANDIKIGVKVDASQAKTGFKEVDDAAIKSGKTISEAFKETGKSIQDMFNGLNKFASTYNKVFSKMGNIMSTIIGPMGSVVALILKLSVASLVFKAMVTGLRMVKNGITMMWAAWNKMIVVVKDDKVMRAFQILITPLTKLVELMGMLAKKVGVHNTMLKPWLATMGFTNKQIDKMTKGLKLVSDQLDKSKTRLQAVTGNKKAMAKVSKDLSGYITATWKSLKKTNPEFKLMSETSTSIAKGAGGMVGKFQKFAGTLQKIGGPLGKMAGKLMGILNKLPGGALAAGAFFAAFAVGVKTITGAVAQMAALGDEIDKMSQKIGFSAQGYQEWNRVFNLAGSNMNEMANSMTRFTQNMGDAARGIGKGKDSFEALGIAIKNEDGSLRNAEATFKDTILSLAKMRDVTARNARVFELFGKSGKQLIPVLNAGSEGIAELLKESEKYVTVSDKQRRASVAYTDTMFDLKQMFTKFKNEALEPFLIMFTQTLQMLKDSSAFKLLGGALMGLAKVAGVAFGIIIKGLHVVLAAFDTAAFALHSLLDSMIQSFNWIAQKMPGIPKMMKKTFEIMAQDSTAAVEESAKNLGKNWTKALSLGFDEESIRGTLQDVGGIVKNETTKQISEIDKLLQSLHERRLKVTLEGRIQLIHENAMREIDIVDKSNKDIDTKSAARNQILDEAMREEQRIRDEWLANMVTFEKVAVKTITRTAEGMKLEAGDISVFDAMMGVKPGDTFESVVQTRKDGVVNFTNSIVNSTMDMVNSISQIRQNANAQDLADLQATQSAELASSVHSTRSKLRLERKFAKDQEKIQKEQAKKQKALNVTQALVGLASGIAGIWSNSYKTIPNPIAAAVVAGTNTALLTGVTIAQIAAMNSQSFATGGVVGGFQGATQGPDNTVANVRRGEMVLTATQQRNMFNAIDSGNLGGTVGDINITIEGNADDSTVAALEELSSNMLETTREAIRELNYRGELAI